VSRIKARQKVPADSTSSYYVPLADALLVISLIAGRVGVLIPPRQRKWMQAIRQRVEVTTGTIRSIRSIKISGLTNQAMGQITDLRVAEINDQKAFRRIQVSNIAIGLSTIRVDMWRLARCVAYLLQVIYPA
jgi:hypothetical protein